MSNDLAYYQNKYAVVARISSSNTRHKVACNLLGFLLAIVILPIVIGQIRTVQQGSSIESSLQILLIIPLFLTVFLFLHERLHFIALWRFSKNKPELRLFSVLLKPNSSVTRREGLISYLLPFLVITTVFGGVSIFVGTILRVVFLVVALMHVPQCCYDFVDSFILMKCRGNNIRVAHEKSGAGFDTVFFLFS
jgi:hypothetical protein